MPASTGLPTAFEITHWKDHNRLRHQEGHKDLKDTLAEMVSPGKQALLLSSGPSVQSLNCSMAFHSQTFKKSFRFFLDNLLPPPKPQGTYGEGGVGAEKGHREVSKQLGRNLVMS